MGCELGLRRGVVIPELCRGVVIPGLCDPGVAPRGCASLTPGCVLAPLQGARGGDDRMLWGGCGDDWMGGRWWWGRLDVMGWMWG